MLNEILLREAIIQETYGSRVWIRSLENWLAYRVAGLTECARSSEWKTLDMIRSRYAYLVLRNHPHRRFTAPPP